LNTLLPVKAAAGVVLMTGLQRADLHQEKMRSDDADAGLNSSQRLHLLTSSQHADKLLAEVEAILVASNSKSAFRKYKNALPLAQAKVVQDYIARIRTQMIRVLESQGIGLPEPSFESVHSIRVTLAFVRIAFQECTADRMRGYGEVPESKVRELNGLVDEMVAAVEKLDTYLAQGMGQDLETRLARLAETGADVGLLKNLERIVNDHGMVEFRPTLSMILDRLESKNFEIALFGRVSSGKSSLLNHIVQTDILPVGVTPITAVPTRLIYGETPQLSVWYADRSPERADIARLAELVSEHQNPGNYKHVTRILVELSSDRLRNGVVLVDTPGLGSLATSGAAETLAYLPRCDLGVVLVDAGSTLTEDDIGTIRALHEAGIPASVLLSKSDLLAPEDRDRSSTYISEHIRSQLGLTISIHPVSVQPTHSSFLDAWLKDVLVPLYDRHQQLAHESLSRKIGALRETVITTLKLRLDRAPEDVQRREDQGPVDAEQIDSTLRKAVGRITEIRQLGFETTHAIRQEAERALDEAANALLNAWAGGGTALPSNLVAGELLHVAAERAGTVSKALKDLAVELSQALQTASKALGYQEAPAEHDFKAFIKEMPKLDLGTLDDLQLHPPIVARLSRSLALGQTRRALHRQIGQQAEHAFSNLGSMLDSWARRILGELQLRFETHADQYRVHLSRMGAHGNIQGTDQTAILRDLDSLGEAQTEEQAQMAPVP
jgi:GTP-binding protein EngB required for normal cell division